MPSYRFRRLQRLHLQRDFARVFARRCAAADGPLVLYVDDAGLDYARLGLKVGKAAGNAVLRNREKRRLREAFRLLQHELPALDMVCVLKTPPEASDWYRKALPPLAAAAARKLARRLAQPK